MSISVGAIASFIMGFALVVGSILAATDRPQSFVDFPSVLVVLGGTLAALFSSFEPQIAFATLKKMLTALKRPTDSELSLKDEVGRIVRWAYIVQKNGLQGLENEISEQLREEDAFLATGADLVVTGYTGAEIKQIMEHMLESQAIRDAKTTDALKKMGGDSPAFGMLGTLIGLVIMLGNMGGDPAAIGPSMAVALITTFYGIILARLVFIPLSTKLAARNDVTLFKNNLQMEGLILLAERKSPRYIQDKINSFVDVKEQFSIDRDLNNPAANS